MIATVPAMRQSPANSAPRRAAKAAKVPRDRAKVVMLVVVRIHFTAKSRLRPPRLANAFRMARSLTDKGERSAN